MGSKLECGCGRKEHTSLSCGVPIPEHPSGNDPRVNHGRALLMIADQNRRIADLETALRNAAKIRVHKGCGGAVVSRLFASDAEKDYYVSCCLACNMSPEMAETELVDVEVAHG